MSFNKSAVKRLSIVAGIPRISKEVTTQVNELVIDYLLELLRRLQILATFCDRKTITLIDIRFLGQLNYLPKIAFPSNLDRLACGKIQALPNLSYHHYQLYTLMTPFADMVRKNLNREHRLEKNVILVLQFLIEHRVVKVLSEAYQYTKVSHRDTLLPEDFTAALTHT